MLSCMHNDDETIIGGIGTRGAILCFRVVELDY